MAAQRYRLSSWFMVRYVLSVVIFMNVLDLGKLALGKKLTFNL